MATKKTGLQAELNVSADLAAIIGTKKGEKISRPQVIIINKYHMLKTI